MEKDRERGRRYTITDDENTKKLIEFTGLDKQERVKSDERDNRIRYPFYRPFCC